MTTNPPTQSIAQEASFDTKVIAWPAAWRAAAGCLKVIARGSLLATLAMFLFSDNPPTNPLRQLRLFGALFLAPELAAWCIARAFTGRAQVKNSTLVISLQDRLIEVPFEAIAAIQPWSLPIPGAGLWIKLRSGRRLERGLGLADPVAFTRRLIDAGAAPSLRSGLETPMVVYVAARLANPPMWLDHPLLKFVLFPLVPTLPVFRMHQYITYGGTFGEYYTFGLQAYLLGLLLWWVSWALGLLLVAAAARAIIEIGTLGAAFVAPSYAAGLRRSLEIVVRLIYYLGIPVWMALRLLA